MSLTFTWCDTIGPQRSGPECSLRDLLKARSVIYALLQTCSNSSNRPLSLNVAFRPTASMEKGCFMHSDWKLLMTSGSLKDRRSVEVDRIAGLHMDTARKIPNEKGVIVSKGISNYYCSCVCNKARSN